MDVRGPKRHHRFIRGTSQWISVSSLFVYFTFLLCCLLSKGYSREIFVSNVTGNSSHECGGEENPCSSLSLAFNVSHDNDIIILLDPENQILETISIQSNNITLRPVGSSESVPSTLVNCLVSQGPCFSVLGISSFLIQDLVFVASESLNGLYFQVVGSVRPARDPPPSTSGSDEGKVDQRHKEIKKEGVPISIKDTGSHILRNCLFRDIRLVSNNLIYCRKLTIPNRLVLENVRFSGVSSTLHFIPVLVQGSLLSLINVSVDGGVYATSWMYYILPPSVSEEYIFWCK